jgi:UDP-N-acetyl-D-galactosamine dehydrogenase
VSNSDIVFPDDPCICIVGLGYVGLPLVIEFSKKYRVIGFDSDSKKIKLLEKGIDPSGEVDIKNQDLTNIVFSSNSEEIISADVYIIAVPTPITSNQLPDTEYLEQACLTVGPYIHQGNGIIFESTVYPGATEEICIPLLEKCSGIKLHTGFYVGYSPERINPGDKEKTLRDIIKITSGSCHDSAIFINSLYQEIVDAGTYIASSIKVAEAAKVIENIQRDVNIALFNELAMLFDKLEISSSQVFDAAATKWNFARYTPGLVGGHCIGVDPYYLTFKALSEGFNPQMILAGRSVNESMPDFIASRLHKELQSIKTDNKKYRVLILGATFKENCKDIRNSKSFALYEELKNQGISVDISDELADSEAVELHYSVQLADTEEESKYDAVIIAVAHNYIKEMGIENIRLLGASSMLIYDLKSVFSEDVVDFRL